jgi:hypothetical protein
MHSMIHWRVSLMAEDKGSLALAVLNVAIDTCQLE